MSGWSHFATVLTMSSALVLSGCGEDASAFFQVEPPNGNFCAIDTDSFADGGVGKDGIPALTDPPLTNAVGASYLAPDDRVIGLVVDGKPLAVPHNILWYHEIVNLNLRSAEVAVTYCPLTGSSMVFDRASVDGAGFGVSGLLFNNNLTMYDRREPESLWPQMNRTAGCGDETGQELEMVASFEMTWQGWTDLYPTTEVVSDQTGVRVPSAYQFYPYQSFDYENIDNDFLLFPQGPIDKRRPPKERVLGVALADGGKAYPFGELDSSPLNVVNDRIGTKDAVVFWDRSKRGAVAFDSVVNGEKLMFEVDADSFRDRQTGSEWSFAGEATSGELEGARLTPLSNAYVAFWFAWASFQPVAALWQAAS